MTVPSTPRTTSLGPSFDDPAFGRSVGPRRSPQWLDARTLAMHRLMVQKIRENPALFEKLGRTLAHWKAVTSPDNHHYLDAWEKVLQAGPEAVFAMALEESDRGQAMRSSSPFAGILTNAERWAFLKAWEQHETD